MQGMEVVSEIQHHLVPLLMQNGSFGVLVFVDVIVTLECIHLYILCIVP